MEAMTLGYPPEEVGYVSVTAPPWEWREVLETLDWADDHEQLSHGARQLRAWLMDMGVAN
jgi:hypothetical protein